MYITNLSDKQKIYISDRKEGGGGVNPISPCVHTCKYIIIGLLGIQFVYINCWLCQANLG